MVLLDILLLVDVRSYEWRGELRPALEIKILWRVHLCWLQGFRVVYQAKRLGILRSDQVALLEVVPSRQLRVELLCQSASLVTQSLKSLLLLDLVVAA